MRVSGGDVAEAEDGGRAEPGHLVLVGVSPRLLLARLFGAYQFRALLLTLGGCAGSRSSRSWPASASKDSASGSIFLPILLRTFSFRTHARLIATTPTIPNASAATAAGGGAYAAAAKMAAYHTRNTVHRHDGACRRNVLAGRVRNGRLSQMRPLSMCRRTTDGKWPRVCSVDSMPDQTRLRNSFTAVIRAAKSISSSPDRAMAK